jgi:hypothetical protein
MTRHLPELMRYESSWHVAATLVEVLALYIAVPVLGVFLAFRMWAPGGVKDRRSWITALFGFAAALVTAMLVRDTALALASSGVMSGDVTTSTGTVFSPMRLLILVAALVPLLGILALTGLTGEETPAAARHGLRERWEAAVAVLVSVEQKQRVNPVSDSHFAVALESAREARTSDLPPDEESAQRFINAVDSAAILYQKAETESRMESV